MSKHGIGTNAIVIGGTYVGAKPNQSLAEINAMTVDQIEVDLLGKTGRVADHRQITK